MILQHRSLLASTSLIALATALSASAVRADEPAYAHKPAPKTHYVEHEPYKPSQYYVGGAVGRSRTGVSFTHQELESSNGIFVGGPPYIPSTNNEFLNARGTNRMDIWSTTVSGFAGINYWYGKLLLGAEIDATYIGGHQRKDNLNDLQTGFHEVFTSARLSHMETIRARLGVQATPKTMLYVTGGLALGDIELSQSQNYYGGSDGAQAVRVWRAGWVIGGGFEHKLSAGVSLRGEYLYSDFGKFSQFARPVCPTITAHPWCDRAIGDQPFEARFTVTNQMARLGLVVELSPVPQAPTYGGSLKDDGHRSSGGSDFTGLYLTPSGGWLSGKTKFKPAIGSFNTVYDANSSGGPAFFNSAYRLTSLEDTALNRALVSPTDEFTAKVSGLTLGGVLGYQKQFPNNWVLGADVGLSFGQASGSVDCTPKGLTAAQLGDFSAKCDSHFRYMAAVRGRLGYVHNNVHWFVTGGPAFLKLQNKIEYSGTIEGIYADYSASDFNEYGSAFARGWTMGLGFEYEYSPGMVFALSYNHTKFNAVAADMRRADGVTFKREFAVDPDVFGAAIKVKLGDTQSTGLSAPAPAAQPVAAAPTPPPAPRPAAVAPARAPQATAPRPAAARPAPAAAAQPAPVAPVAPPVATTPVDGTPVEPLPVPGKPAK